MTIALAVAHTAHHNNGGWAGVGLLLIAIGLLVPSKKGPKK